MGVISWNLPERHLQQPAQLLQNKSVYSQTCPLRFRPPPLLLNRKLDSYTNTSAYSQICPLRFRPPPLLLSRRLNSYTNTSVYHRNVHLATDPSPLLLSRSLNSYTNTTVYWQTFPQRLIRSHPPIPSSWGGSTSPQIRQYNDQTKNPLPPPPQKKGFGLADFVQRNR